MFLFILSNIFATSEFLGSSIVLTPYENIDDDSYCSLLISRIKKFFTNPNNVSKNVVDKFFENETPHFFTKTVNEIFPEKEVKIAFLTYVKILTDGLKNKNNSLNNIDFIPRGYLSISGENEYVILNKLRNDSNVKGPFVNFCYEVFPDGLSDYNEENLRLCCYYFSKKIKGEVVFEKMLDIFEPYDLRMCDDPEKSNCRRVFLQKYQELKNLSK